MKNVTKIILSIVVIVIGTVAVRTLLFSAPTLSTAAKQVPLTTNDSAVQHLSQAIHYPTIASNDRIMTN